MRAIHALTFVALAGLVGATTPSCSNFADCVHTKTCEPSAGSDGGSSNAGGGAGGAGTAGVMSNGGAAGEGGKGGGGAGLGNAGSAGAAPCDGACGGATSACDSTTNTCVECVTGEDCKAPRPACDVQTNTCVECVDKGDCSGAKPACDVATNTCVECSASTDCKDGTKPLCDTTANHCVACLKQADCTAATASACNAGVCSACTKDEECSNISGRGVCDAGTCVQCTGKKFAACGQDAGTPLVCDSLKRTCSTSKQQSSGLCETCVSDAQCSPGQMCVLDKFGTPAKDVGYFCHWKQGDPAGGAPANCSLTGRPYSDTLSAVTSIDGSISDICTLRTSTCIANNQFGSKDCTSASAPNDAVCGFAPGEDSKCALYNLAASTYRCTMTCGFPEDCPSPFTCKTGASPRVCSFN